MSFPKTPLVRKTVGQFLLPFRKRLRRPLLSVQNLRSNPKYRYARALKILDLLALEFEILSLSVLSP